jgi:hypothetical protein
MSTDAHSFDAEILTAVVAPQAATLAPQVAETLLGWRFNDAETERMPALAEKNRRDALTPDEQEELASFVRVGEFLNLVHAKAHASLAAATCRH